MRKGGEGADEEGRGGERRGEKGKGGEGIGPFRKFLDPPLPTSATDHCDRLMS